uniref:Adaptor protein ClpS core domain-containing protein n=1 Tax=Coccolithus braarudii TaxID=221442 RepID=A0A7S0LJY8_9EUKA
MLFLAILAVAVVGDRCRVVVRDDNENSAEEVIQILHHLGLSYTQAQGAVREIMQAGQTTVLNAESDEACDEVVRTLSSFGLSASTEHAGADGQTAGDAADAVECGDPHNIDDLIRTL